LQFEAGSKYLLKVQKSKTTAATFEVGRIP
jgi:hypothetical protein